MHNLHKMHNGLLSVTLLRLPMRAVLTGVFAGLLVAMVVTLSLAADSPAASRYRVLAQDNGHVAIVNGRGEVEWEVECKHNSHDIALLENGNLLLHAGPAKIVEMTPSKQVVWQYESQPKPPYTGRVEIHAFQRLPDGSTMIAESGNRRIVEVDRGGQIV